MKLNFVVHKHAATHLHYDVRLEHAGVLKSWAVPKQPPLRSGLKRLAKEVEDHKLSYRTFQGVIPEGSYGAGTVEIWDSGTYENITQHQGEHVPFEKAYNDGKLEIWFHGEKLSGAYVLLRTQGSGERSSWLFFKMKPKTATSKKKLLQKP